MSDAELENLASASNAPPKKRLTRSLVNEMLRPWGYEMLTAYPPIDGTYTLIGELRKGEMATRERPRWRSFQIRDGRLL